MQTSPSDFSQHTGLREWHSERANLLNWYQDLIKSPRIIFPMIAEIIKIPITNPGISFNNQGHDLFCAITNHQENTVEADNVACRHPRNWVALALITQSPGPGNGDGTYSRLPARGLRVMIANFNASRSVVNRVMIWVWFNDECAGTDVRKSRICANADYNDVVGGRNESTSGDEPVHSCRTEIRRFFK